MCTVLSQQIKRNLFQRAAQEKTRQKVSLVEDRAAACQHLTEVLALERGAAWINAKNLTEGAIGEDHVATLREDKATARKRIERIAIKARWGWGTIY